MLEPWGVLKKFFGVDFSNWPCLGAGVVNFLAVNCQIFLLIDLVCELVLVA